PDHCHEPTLRTLSPSTPLALCAPAAAAALKSWSILPGRVEALQQYDPATPSSLRRIPVPALGCAHGEITVALMLPPWGSLDVNGLHTALGITYTSPTAPGIQPEHISILYSPHGLPAASIEPWAKHVLRGERVTVLFHSLSVVDTPWWMGGNVARGVEGGLEVARVVRPRVWVAAHEGRKHAGGLMARVGGVVRRGVEVQDVRVEGVRVLGLGGGESVVVDAEGGVEGGERGFGRGEERGEGEKEAVEKGRE
ncbi:hypothetical protein EJ06DRAFT_557089, partial [Trichodelitschia bisporula]